METELIITTSRREIIQRQKSPRKFVKGPIPFKWIQTASLLGANEARFAWLLWFMYGVNKGASFTVSNSRAEGFGIERRQKYRALSSLKKAGLISIDYRLGTAQKITVIPDD